MHSKSCCNMHTDQYMTGNITFNLHGENISPNIFIVSFLFLTMKSQETDSPVQICCRQANCLKLCCPSCNDLECILQHGLECIVFNNVRQTRNTSQKLHNSKHGITSDQQWTVRPLNTEMMHRLQWPSNALVCLSVCAHL